MHRRRLAAFLPALALVFVSAWAFADHTSSSRYVPYQGRLEHAGAPVDATVQMTFGFYAAASGGTALDTVTLDVDVDAGAFAVDIGPVADEVFDATALYLGVTVDGVELPMRQAIRAVPYAMHGQVGESFTADEVVAGSVTAGSLGVTGNGTIHNVHLGNMGFGTTWAGFRHASIADGVGAYALLQNSTGTETLLNTGSGGSIGFRVGNNTVATLDSDGDLDVDRVITGDGTAIGGMTVSSTYTASASMSAGVSIWEQTMNSQMTPSATSFCALARDYFNYSSSHFGTGDQASFSTDCTITDNGTRWVLTAYASRAYHHHSVSHECRARCLSWE